MLFLLAAFRHAYCVEEATEAIQYRYVYLGTSLRYDSGWRYPKIVRDVQYAILIRWIWMSESWEIHIRLLKRHTRCESVHTLNGLSTERSIVCCIRVRLQNISLITLGRHDIPSVGSLAEIQARPNFVYKIPKMDNRQQPWNESRTVRKGSSNGYKW